MSALNKVKGLLLFNMKGAEPELKKALIKVINCIDSDLDIHGYEPSSETDDAFTELDNILVNLDEASNNPIQAEEPLLIQKTRIPREPESEG